MFWGSRGPRGGRGGGGGDPSYALSVVLRNASLPSPDNAMDDCFDRFMRGVSMRAFRRPETEYTCMPMHSIRDLLSMLLMKDEMAKVHY